MNEIFESIKPLIKEKMEKLKKDMKKKIKDKFENI